MTDLDPQPRRRHSHAPEHRLVPGATYFVTAGTLHKAKLFVKPDHLDQLQQTILETIASYGWCAQAWACFPNHYHFVAADVEERKSIEKVIRRIHSQSARELNRSEGRSGRTVWYQYRDTCLNYEKSWLARLKYVMQNPVKHGLVQRAEDYAWCSAAWFAENAPPGFRQTVEGFPIDRLDVPDDF